MSHKIYDTPAAKQRAWRLRQKALRCGTTVTLPVPYYQDDWVTLYCGDCTALLPLLAPASVDLVLTDPPYGVSRGKKNLDRSRWTSKAARQRILIRDFGPWDQFADDAAYWDFMRAWLGMAAVALRPGGALLCCMMLEALGDLRGAMTASGCVWVQTVLWCKRNPAPQFVGAKQFAYAAEGIGFARKPARGEHKTTWNGPNTIPNWIATPLCQGKERTAHPTQKPLALISPLIGYLSNSGDLILDPFAGAGTTLVAAKSMGRRAIGVERDECYCEIAAQRLRAVSRPMDLAI